MEETDTTITWPSKLKIGAKSKKGESTIYDTGPVRFKAFA